MNRRKFLKMAGMGVSAAALEMDLVRALAAEVAGGRKKNVLFFFVDDMRVQLGCYGKTQVKSPNIDKLAADGTLFERAYCSQAICAPTRICTLSGVRPDSTGIYGLDNPLRASGNDVVTLPQHFKQRGYETITIGKVYHHRDDDKDNWSRMPSHEGRNYASPENRALLKQKEAESKEKGLTGRAKSQHVRGPAAECADVPDEAYSDGGIAKAAVEQLRELKDRSFFMCVGFYKPHLPFCAPQKYWDLYKREEFAVPDRKKPEAMPPVALGDFGELRSYTDIPKAGPIDDEGTRQLLHGYHACVSFTDAQVGKVLAELDALGLAQNTVVVIWGDHGWKLGEYGSWCKHTNFELDTHVPLIFRGPGIAVGKRCKHIVEMVDVYPTLADLTDGAVPGHCAGASMRALLEKGESADWKNMAVSQYPRSHEGQPVMGYSLRKDQWRYTEWHRKDGKVVAKELYDHSGSGIASVNVADKPEHTELVEKLSALLKPFVKTRWESLGGGNKSKAGRENKSDKAGK
jgi:iduronate 2-sulfatase